MSPLFDQVFTRTLVREGGYSDDAADSGGRTRYGITESVARANGYHGPMSQLPIETAHKIAKVQYWDTLRLDEIAAIAPLVAAELFDTGYNMGVARAGRFLQRVLNALNREGSDYPDLVADGVVGPMSVAALRAFIALRGPEGQSVLLKALDCLQGAFYVQLAEERPKDERFVYGWLRTRIGEAA